MSCSQDTVNHQPNQYHIPLPLPEKQTTRKQQQQKPPVNEVSHQADDRESKMSEMGKDEVMMAQKYSCKLHQNPSEDYIKGGLLLQTRNLTLSQKNLHVKPSAEDMLTMTAK